MSGVLLFLIGWSVVSAVWWLLAVALVQGSRSRRWGGSNPVSVPLPPLSLFKPLPVVPGPDGIPVLARAIESFLEQMDGSCELLLGVPEEQAALWDPVLEDWGRRFPGTAIRPRVLPSPRQRANPKIAWLEWMAPEARGTVWLWSDADITAPPGLLTGIRTRLEAEPAIGAVTVPYGVRRTGHAAGWLDALFVNMEFLPGTLLLERQGPVPLAFGAAVLFRAEDFRKRVSWDDLGASLADDHELGRQLGPVRISGPVAETCALETRLGSALRHVYRWQKTIRWCRPGGFAALVVILPLLGWSAALGSSPEAGAVWSGFGVQYALEVGVAAVLLNRVGFHGPRWGWVHVLAWPAVRCGLWLAAWLPLSVVWQDPAQSWSEARRTVSKTR